VSLPPPLATLCRRAPRYALAPHALPSRPALRRSADVSLPSPFAPHAHRRHLPAVPPAHIAVCCRRWGGSRFVCTWVLDARPGPWRMPVSRTNSTLPTVPALERPCACPVSLVVESDLPFERPNGNVVTTVTPLLLLHACLRRVDSSAHAARGVNSTLHTVWTPPRTLLVALTAPCPPSPPWSDSAHAMCLSSLTALCPPPHRRPVPTANQLPLANNDQLVSCALALPPKAPRALLPQTTSTDTRTPRTRTHSLSLCLSPAHPLPPS
jgi:hypothetical protein